MDSFPHNIFLVGLMGSGKTTVGRALARRLKLQFLDSDHEIEAQTGVRIATIFDLEGEAGFRAREFDMIERLTRRDGIILATGGGCVLDYRSRQFLHERGIVVYLRAEIDQLWLRTRHDRSRPLLQASDPKLKLQKLHDERDPLYKECAHLIITTAQQSVARMASQLESLLRQRLALETGAAITDAHSTTSLFLPTS